MEKEKNELVKLLKEGNYFWDIEDVNDEPNSFVITTNFSGPRSFLPINIKIEGNKYIISHMIMDGSKVPLKVIKKINDEFVIQKSGQIIKKGSDDDITLVKSVDKDYKSLQYGMITLIQYAIRYDTMAEFVL